MQKAVIFAELEGEYLSGLSVICCRYITGLILGCYLNRVCIILIYLHLILVICLIACRIYGIAIYNDGCDLVFLILKTYRHVEWLSESLSILNTCYDDSWCSTIIRIIKFLCCRVSNLVSYCKCYLVISVCHI